MTATWTEAFSSFTPAGTGWQNYDLYTNKSVPKGAVAYIICANGNDTTDIFMGVRTDGSSLERRINLHEAEDGGYTLYGMYVTCDASTGYIETYVDSTTDAIFYLMGYWTGAPFTERWDSFSGSTASAWNQFTCDSSFPASCAVQTVIISKAAAASRTMGCRSGDSSTNRQFTFHEAEGTDADACEPATWMVKLNASKQFGAFIHVIADNPVYVTGYFDPSYLNYVETARAGVNVASASKWVDWDISASLDQDGRVLDCYVLHKNYAAEANMGFRKNGSSLARYISIHEAEHTSSKYYTGYFVPTETDTSGIVEAYTTDTTNEWMGMWGYYVPNPISTKEYTDSAAVADVVGANKTLPLAQAIGLADAMGRKTMSVLQSLGVGDISKMGKTLALAQGISTGEAVKFAKTIVGPQSIGTGEAVKFTKTLVGPQSISAGEGVKMGKTLPMGQSIGTSDARAVNKTIPLSQAVGIADKFGKTMALAQAIGLGDAVVRGKNIALAQAVGIGDSINRGKVISYAQSVGISDAVARLKTFLLTQAVGVGEAVKMTKTLLGPQSIGVAEAAKTSKTLLLAQSIGVANVLSKKTMLIAASYGVADSYVRNKTLPLAQNVAMAERFGKTMRVESVIDVAEARRVNKNIVGPQSVTTAEVVRFEKTLVGPESIGADDALSLDKTMKVAQAIGVADVRAVSKSMSFVQAIGVADVLSSGRTMMFAQAVGMADAFVKRTTLTANTIGVADGRKVNKTMQVAQAVAVGEARVVSKTILVGQPIGIAERFDRTMRVLQAVGVSDAAHMKQWVVRVAEALALDDSVYAGRLGTLKTYTDGIGMGDAMSAISKGKLFAETIGVSDVRTVSKTLKLAQSVGVADRFGKTMRVAQNVAVADSVRMLQWVVRFAQNVGVVDRFHKTMRISQGIGVADALRMPRWYVHYAQGAGMTDRLSGRTFAIASTLAVSDVGRTNTTRRVAESVEIADSVARSMLVRLSESIGVHDIWYQKLVGFVVLYGTVSDALTLLGEARTVLDADGELAAIIERLGVAAQQQDLNGTVMEIKEPLSANHR